jgi:hypothetical protein
MASMTESSEFIGLFSTLTTLPAFCRITGVVPLSAPHHLGILVQDQAHIHIKQGQIFINQQYKNTNRLVIFILKRLHHFKKNKKISSILI